MLDDVLDLLFHHTLGFLFVREAAYVWWCFFCNNQFRLLQNNETASTEELAETFGANVRRIGKMWIMMDNYEQADIASRDKRTHRHSLQPAPPPTY